jgi:hypothetical protein
MNFFEHMGYLLEGKYLDLEGVSVEFHYRILRVWSDAKDSLRANKQRTPFIMSSSKKW